MEAAPCPWLHPIEMEPWNSAKLFVAFFSAQLSSAPCTSSCWLGSNCEQSDCLEPGCFHPFPKLLSLLWTLKPVRITSMFSYALRHCLPNRLLPWGTNFLSGSLSGCNLPSLYLLIFIHWLLLPEPHVAQSKTIWVTVHDKPRGRGGDILDIKPFIVVTFQCWCEKVLMYHLFKEYILDPSGHEVHESTCIFIYCCLPN